MAQQLRIVDCTHAEHGRPILEILNEAIVNSTALYDYEPRPASSMLSWFENKARREYPVIGALDSGERLLGFASYGTFRDWPAYKYTVEHSVYVHVEHRGRGIGRLLLEQLIARAKQQQFHAMIGGIDRDNAASVALHEKLGFRQAGILFEAGFKFGRWLDLAFYQLLLDTPRAPRDG